jgi:hypothetical protein
MLKEIKARVACILVLPALLSCGSHRLERDFFFKNPPATRLERFRQYSLEDQYKIFRYGNDRFEPPIMMLPEPIAERGATAVPFLVAQLKSSTDDVTVRDILVIFKAMANAKSYGVNSDAVLMTTITSRISRMKDKDWQSFCLDILQRLKNAQ